jgi:transcriptional regulator with XRE-family HTH domain
MRQPGGGRTGTRRAHAKKAAKVIDLGVAAKKQRREIRIGAQLRHARLTKDLSLRQLAEAVGCSESFVSKIENNKVRPSIAMLHALCSELDINVGTLFEEPGDGFGDVQVLRQGKRRVIHVDPEWQGKDVTLEQVVPQRAASLLQANILEVAPGGYSDGLIEHTGEEFSYMLAGTLELTIGKETYRLMPGDSVFFRSPLAHGYRNVSNEVARVLWVNTPPTF